MRGPESILGFAAGVALFVAVVLFTFGACVAPIRMHLGAVALGFGGMVTIAMVFGLLGYGAYRMGGDLTLRRRLGRALEYLTWRLLIWSARRWAGRYMDQWDKVKWATPYGDIYLTIGMEDRWPSSFDRVDARGRVICQAGLE